MLVTCLREVCSLSLSLSLSAFVCVHDGTQLPANYGWLWQSSTPAAAAATDCSLGAEGRSLQAEPLAHARYSGSSCVLCTVKRDGPWPQLLRPSVGLGLGPCAGASREPSSRPRLALVSPSSCRDARPPASPSPGPLSDARRRGRAQAKSPGGHHPSPGRSVRCGNAALSDRRPHVALAHASRTPGGTCNSDLSVEQPLKAAHKRRCRQRR